MLCDGIGNEPAEPVFFLEKLVELPICAVGAKSVTEKTTWLACVGGAAKRQRSPQQLPFCQCAMPCKGDGFLMHENHNNVWCLIYFIFDFMPIFN